MDLFRYIARLVFKKKNFVNRKYRHKKRRKCVKNDVVRFICGVLIYQPILMVVDLYVPYKINGSNRVQDKRGQNEANIDFFPLDSLCNLLSAFC